MGRVYEAPFSNVSVSVVQDLFMLQTTSGMACRILEVVLGQITQTSVESLRLTFKRFSGSYTPGSGGSAATVAKHNFGDAAATCTVGVNETTQTVVGSGAVVVVRGDVYNEVNGYDYLAIPDKEIILAPSQAFVVSLDTAPGAARVMNGAITFEELY